MGDGYCDDTNNNFYCNFDEGDCCGLSIIATYCQECACIDDEFRGILFIDIFLLHRKQF